MGFFQGVQPKLRKVGVGPALMIAAASPACLLLPLTQKASQAHPDPGIQSVERGVVTVFEVPKPSSQNRVELRDGVLKAVAARSPRVFAYRVLEFVHAFLPGPSVASLEVVPQKVKAAGF